MLGAFEERVGGALAAWVGLVSRRPVTTILALLLVSTASGLYAGQHLSIQGDTDSLFSADLPFQRNARRYYEAFPRQLENMFVVLDGVTPERAGEAASALAKRLSAETDDFHMVYLPGGGAFFERNAFLYLDTDQLQDLADDLAKAEPYLAELSRDGSIRGLASILARGARAVREGDVDPERLASIYAHTTEALAAVSAGREYHLSWAEVLASHKFESNPRRRVLFVQPVLHVQDLQPARRAIETVRRVAGELGLSPANGVRVRITGDAALSYEEMEVVKSQAAMAGIGSFVLVALILFAGIRSPRLVLSILATLLVGLVLTAGFTAIAVGHFNMISAAFAVLFIGLGVDFGIHICMRYRELLSEGLAHGDALYVTARDVGSSLALCAVTTAIGFFAFVPTGFVGVAELGLISGAGMLISLFCFLTFLPALMSLPPVARPGASIRSTIWTGRVVELPVRHPKLVRGVALVLAAGSVLLLPKARFDNNPLNVRDPSSESVQTLSELLDQGTRSPWTLNAIAPDVRSANALAVKLRALDQVDRVVTIADYVPSDQAEKLDIIEDVALFLGPITDPSGAKPAPTVEQQLRALRHLENELGKLPTTSLPHDFAVRAEALRTQLARFRSGLTPENAKRTLATLQQDLLGSLPEQLRILNAALGAGRVTLENLPDALVDQMIGEQGQVRVEIFPKKDLKDQAALAAFVDAVHRIAPQASGSAAEITGSARTVVRALQQALLSALVAETLVVFLLWRRVTDTALVLIPLALATSFTVATAVLLRIPFNYADVIVLPLLLGIGVDSGIHLVHRARVSADPSQNLLRTSTARAVAYSALTTVASFGTLGLASHRGLATLGQLLTIGVVFMLICNLIVLPALLELRGRRAEAALAARSEA